MTSIETLGIVKIIAHTIDFDIFSPYKIKGENEMHGSGFFIDLDGHILTCAHVIEHSIKIYITLPDVGKQKIEVELLSVCFDKDIALLKVVNYKNKYFCKLGDSDKIKQGDTVIAVGYPLSQATFKITEGIISGRTNRYIQTDAPINSGNSGGALINKNLEVIGINTSKITGADGIGFALPIQEYNIIKKELFSGKKILYEPQALFKGMNSDDALFNLLGFTEKMGYFIKKIYHESPFCIAGMRSTDIIISFNDWAVDNHGECVVPWSIEKVHIKDLISRFNSDTPIKISYWRFNEGIKHTVLNLSFDNIYKIKKIYQPIENVDYEIVGGIVIMELNVNHILSLYINKNISKRLELKLEAYYETKNRFDSVLFISDVLSGSYISTLDNIEVGEIINSVNGKNVKTIVELRNVLKNNITVNDTLFTIIQTDENTLITIDIEKYEKTEKEQLFKSHKINDIKNKK